MKYLHKPLFQLVALFLCFTLLSGLTISINAQTFCPAGSSAPARFGCATPQPEPPTGEFRNGFLALAVYDIAENGGNLDRQIDSRDSVFTQLKLWQDRNHDGISEPNELQSLFASPIRAIELDYKESRKTDEHGNKFRFRAKVKDAQGAQVGRWAWDVFPVSQH